jgi:hypothetical protein
MKFNGGEDHGKTVWKCKDYRDLLEGKSAWILVSPGEIFDGETGLYTGIQKLARLSPNFETIQIADTNIYDFKKVPIELQKPPGNFTKKRCSKASVALPANTLDIFKNVEPAHETRLQTANRKNFDRIIEKELDNYIVQGPSPSSRVDFKTESSDLTQLASGPKLIKSQIRATSATSKPKGPRARANLVFRTQMTEQTLSKSGSKSRSKSKGSHSKKQNVISATRATANDWHSKDGVFSNSNDPMGGGFSKFSKEATSDAEDYLSNGKVGSLILGESNTSNRFRIIEKDLKNSIGGKIGKGTLKGTHEIFNPLSNGTWSLKPKSSRTTNSPPWKKNYSDANLSHRPMLQNGSKNSQTHAYLNKLSSMEIVVEEQYGKTTRDSLKAPFSNKKQKPQTARPGMNDQNRSAKLSNYQITSNIYSGNIYSGTKFISDVKSQARPVTSSNTGSSNFRLHKGPLKIVSENESGTGIHESLEKEPQPIMMMFSNIDDEIETEFEMYQKDRSPANENSIGNTNEIKGYHPTINGVSLTTKQPKETVVNKTDGAGETSDLFFVNKVDLINGKTMSKGSDDEGTFQEAV